MQVLACYILVLWLQYVSLYLFNACLAIGLRWNVSVQSRETWSWWQTLLPYQAPWEPAPQRLASWLAHPTPSRPQHSPQLEQWRLDTPTHCHRDTQHKVTPTLHLTNPLPLIDHKCIYIYIYIIKSYTLFGYLVIHKWFVIIWPCKVFLH